MSEQVKRYDAVHIRYEDNNIHYGEGCEVEVVTAADYEREVRIAIAAGQRMQDKCDALHAEAESLRVVLHEIASVNPAQRGIEWAKSYASDGLKGVGSELYARWLDTFKEAEALRAENAKLRTALAEQGERQEAVAWALANSADEIGRFAPIYYTKEGAISWANGRNIFPLYTTPQPGQDVRSLVEALEECAASLAWNCLGECRAIHAGPIMPAAMALDTARAALSTHRQAQPQ